MRVRVSPEALKTQDERFVPSMNIDSFVDNYDKVSRGSSDLLSGIFAISSRLPSNSKVLKLISAFGVVNASASLARSAYDFWEENLRKDPYGYKLEIGGDLEAFKIVSKIFMNDPDVQNSSAESYILSSKEKFSPEMAKINFSAENVGTLTNVMEIFGIQCQVTFIPKKLGIKSNEDKISAMKAGSYNDSFVIGFNSASDRSKFVDLMSREVVESSKAPPKLYKASAGFLEFKEKLKTRSLDSVFLKEGQMDRLVNGIEMFKNNSEVYDNLELPYHMGILLYGPPGTGKSTTISALASHFSMDIAWINLSTIPGDESLEDVLDDVPEDCLIVFEDVDSVSATHDRGDSHQDLDGLGRVTTSGLLNVLDGHLTPRGSIFVLTTNHKNKLDPALIRPGRIDYSEEIDHMDSHQFRKFFEFVFKKPAVGFPEINPTHGISPATIMGEVKKEIGDMNLAEEKVRDFVERISRD